MKPVAPLTQPGDVLQDSDRELVEDLRRRLDSALPSAYDTDFNLYRWISFAAHIGAHKTAHSLIAAAEKNLRHHLRYRKAMRLDSEPVPSYEENPLHQGRLLPCGPISGVDKQNRLMWPVEYRSLGMEGIMLKMRSSEMLVYHFWLYELLRRRVVEQEAATGRMSGLHAVMDLDGYPMSPWGMIFVSNGSMGYYTHLLHIEHYPYVVHVADIVNAAKWLALPYRLVRAIMPSGFAEQFRVSDGNLDQLRQDVDPAELADFLGGLRGDLRTIPARPIPKEEYWKATAADPDPASLHHFSVGARRQKVVPVSVRQPNTLLSWYFTTDGDVLFGIFVASSGPSTSSPPAATRSRRRSDSTSSVNQEELRGGFEALEMVEPYFRLAGKLVPESNSVVCERPGLYYMVFCNKASWLTRKSIRLHFDLGPFQSPAKNLLDRALSL